MSREKVVVAMSGGVDSSVAACLLHEQGYEVVGFFMRTGVEHGAAAASNDRHRGCCSASDAADARFVAGKLGIRFYALNFEEQFGQLIDYFGSEYARGRTPNPCVVCNNRLKFGQILDYARSIDATHVATGHYARIGQRGGRAILRRGMDHKDQSYVLFGLNPAVLDRLMFPIGGLSKDQVRAEARRFDLPVADKPDSVEICFVPDRDYASVVQPMQPQAFQPGPVVDDTGRVVGRHDGIGRYTIGQRRGLGIAFGMPIYVTGVNAATNTVTVGPREQLLHPRLSADQCNWLIPAPSPGQMLRVQAQIRHQHRAAPAVVQALEGDRFEVHFDDPQSAITPGQAVVLYDGADCLGGGWIERGFDA